MGVYSMWKDPTTPTQTISEAELFAEFRQTEIVRCDTRGKVKSRTTVEDLLDFPFEHVDFRMDYIGPEPLAQLEAIRDDLLTASIHVGMLIEAFEELQQERVFVNDSEDGEDTQGWPEERYLPAPATEAA
jgi:hypothetical protein